MMARRPAGGKWADVGWLAAVGLLSSAWCLTAAGRTGVTYDESHYVPSGLAGWRDWSCDRLAVWGTMPLPADVQTLPLYLWEQVAGPVSDDLLRILPYARAGNLVFWWLLLIYALRLGRAVGGPWAGRIAAALVAADPSLLGHAALATTDIAVTAFLAALAYHAHAGRAGGPVRRVVVPGLLFGLAVAAKASAILYGGVILLVLEACHRATDGSFTGAARAAVAVARSCAVLAGVAAIGAAVAVTYCGFERGGDGPVAQLAAKVPPDDPWRPALDRVAGWPVVPKAAAVVIFQARHNDHGRGVYLLGTWHPRAVWYYYPAALAMKLPAPVLLLAVGLLLTRPRALANPPALIAAALLVISLTAKVQLGVRLVFPVVAFGLVALAVAAVRGWGWPAGLATAVASAGVAVWAWPNGLSYVNQFAGGPPRAHERLADSNVDWGQGLIELARWHKANGRPPLAVWYFGHDPRAYRPPFRPVALHELPVTCPQDVPALLGPTLLAVGHSAACQSPDETPAKPVVLAWLRTQVPVARTATFAIYDLRPAR